MMITKCVLNISRIYDRSSLLQNTFGIKCKTFHFHRTFMTAKAPTNRIVVYSGPINRPVQFVKLLTLLSSSCGIYLQYSLYSGKIDTGELSVFVKTIFSGLLGFFTFLTPFIIHFITRKYVFRIYHDPHTEKYTALLYSILIKPRSVVFKVEDVIKPKFDRLFITVYVRDNNTGRRVPLLFDDKHFIDIQYYKNIMGYDKPMDFLFINDEKADTNKTEKTETAEVNEKHEEKEKCEQNRR